MLRRQRPAGPIELASNGTETINKRIMIFSETTTREEPPGEGDQQTDQGRQPGNEKGDDSARQNQGGNVQTKPLVDGHRDLRQSERESVQTPVPLPCSSRSWKKKMMAVVAVRNRVCAVLQTPVGAVVCVHRRVGVHSLRAGVSSGGSLG